MRVADIRHRLDKIRARIPEPQVPPATTPELRHGICALLRITEDQLVASMADGSLRRAVVAELERRNDR